MTAESNNNIYLFELKWWIKQKPSLQQIRDRGYTKKIKAKVLRMHLIGIEFSKVQRQIVGVTIEKLK